MTGPIRADQSARPAGTAARPDPVRAITFGAAATLVVGVAWGLLQALLDLDLGLIALAVVGGWVVGTATAWGAWRGADHVATPRIAALAATLAALAWLVGWFVAYLVWLAIVPGSAMSVGETLAAQNFLTWLPQQLSVLDAIELALLALVAFRTAD